jgi:hypothetical protein
VGPAAQSLKLGAGLFEIRGLVEPHLAAHQKLVGADDDSSTTARCNLARFRLGKNERALGRIAPLCPAGPFEEAFVELRRFDPKATPAEASSCARMVLAEARTKSSVIHAVTAGEQFHY